MEHNIQTPFDWDNLPANRYDVAAKHSAHAFPNDMLRLILGTADFEVIEHLDTELPVLDTRRMDSLTKISLEGELTLIHREYQLRDSHPIPVERRNAGYLGRCHERFGLPIRSHVIYFRPPAGRRDPGGYFQNVDEPEYRFIVAYKVIRLYELAGGPVLEAQLPGLMPFVPLMQPPAGVDSIAWLRQCVATTRQLPLNTENIDNLLMATGIFGNLAHDTETLYSIISEEDMRHSSIFQRLMEQPLQEARQTAIQEGLEQGIEQGLELGKEQGLELGKEQGIEQGARGTAIENLIEVLDARFDNQEVTLFKPAFEALTDLQLLKQLHHTALRAPTFDDVIQTLKGYSNNGT